MEPTKHGLVYHFFNAGEGFSLRSWYRFNLPLTLSSSLAFINNRKQHLHVRCWWIWFHSSFSLFPIIFVMVSYLKRKWYFCIFMGACTCQKSYSKVQPSVVSSNLSTGVELFMMHLAFVTSMKVCKIRAHL